MQNKNFDGITYTQTVKSKVRPVDGLVKVRRQRHRLKFWQAWRFHLPVFASAILIVLSFAGGAYLTWSAGESRAVNAQPAVLSSAKNSVSLLPVVEGATALGPIAQVPNEILFNLTLDQLETYLAEEYKTDEMQAAERLADRKFKLKIYLDAKRSPFLAIADTIAELKHWKMVLAISNSESTLGKRCYDNNCSGIGVEPGHPYWREYETKADWAKDLDKLIEKRYKDWTLEEMNGVYNQPGSRNWLLASKQILEELQENSIE